MNTNNVKPPKCLAMTCPATTWQTDKATVWWTQWSIQQLKSETLQELEKIQRRDPLSFIWRTDIQAKTFLCSLISNLIHMNDEKDAHVNADNSYKPNKSSSNNSWWVWGWAWQHDWSNLLGLQMDTITSDARILVPRLKIRLSYAVEIKNWTESRAIGVKSQETRL